MVFKSIKESLSRLTGGDDTSGEYIEIDLEQDKKDNKVVVKLFFLKTYEDVNEVLNALREGYTITLVDIKTLRQKDSIELKRAVSKIKKTVDALEGSIAGFGENIIVATPSFAKIHKELLKPTKDQKSNKFDM
ncbi:hypothetical protein COU57_02500 [Candidatus Pacearchaeota archaeon CG10_big_fil_rev_8_21_14_0_10_32_14]|nr:MAG: hypothetical protein COU57_02500 [Candidatus Pacearchaeota archaeon CG10_big_fil_rev_8_21_14_0_10_32_14]